jgi:tRNA(fMet)-specific endonuclease VapC
VGALIDTSVWVRWQRARTAPAIPPTEPIAMSAVTASELLHGVHRAATAEQRARREAYVGLVLRTVPVVPFDMAVARVHARLWAELAVAGQSIGAHDLLIAATAIARGWGLVTHNRREFDRIPGLEVWEP